MSRVPQLASARSTWTACGRQPRAAARWLLAMPLMLGCGDPTAIQPGDVRRYTAAKEIKAAVAPPQPAPKPQRSIRYETPAGWTDRGSTGMRLATLAIGPPDEGHEVTIIPASGSLEANVARWLGQLDPEATAETLAERAAAALAASEPIEIDGTRATVVALYGQPEADAEPTAAANAGEAILAGVIPIDETASLFVKFKGSAEIARRERENFSRFVSSIRWK